jgi:hypothetical protein
MRTDAEVLKDLGFNQNSPASTREAFFKHLQKSAASDVFPPAIGTPKTEPEQLSFNLDDLPLLDLRKPDPK